MLLRSRGCEAASNCRSLTRRASETLVRNASFSKARSSKQFDARESCRGFEKRLSIHYNDRTTSTAPAPARRTQSCTGASTASKVSDLGCHLRAWTRYYSSRSTPIPNAKTPPSHNPFPDRGGRLERLLYQSGSTSAFPNCATPTASSHHLAGRPRRVMGMLRLIVAVMNDTPALADHSPCGSLRPVTEWTCSSEGRGKLGRVIGRLPRCCSNNGSALPVQRRFGAAWRS